MAKKKIKITGAVSGRPFFLAFHEGEVVELDSKVADDLVKAKLATQKIEKGAKVRRVFVKTDSESEVENPKK